VTFHSALWGQTLTVENQKIENDVEDEKKASMLLQGKQI